MRRVHRFVLHNGEIRNASDLLISPGQVGFLNGWGVFSTLRVSQGVLFAFERHYARLRRDSELLHVPFPFSSDYLQTELLSLVEANNAAEAVLRVAIVRNKGGMFEGPGLKTECALIAFTAELKNWGNGARLKSVPHARFGASPFAGTKSASWSHNLTWLEQVQEQGFDECLLLNEHGHLSECTSANLFIIRGRKVTTPPLDTSGCLPGVTRAILLDEVNLEGIDIGERELTLKDLEDSEMAFLTSTTRDLLPVTEVDARTLRAESEVFDSLRAAFLNIRKAYVADNASRKDLVTS
jgi:branched-chain amino acid aminotransferase